MKIEFLLWSIRADLELNLFDVSVLSVRVANLALRYPYTRRRGHDGFR